MTLDRQTKEGLVERYSQTFAQTQNAFVLDYRGITVPQVTELRAKVREVGGHYEVVKNSLALLRGLDLLRLVFLVHRNPSQGSRILTRPGPPRVGPRVCFG